MVSDRYKNLFLIGAAKAGTTFLYDQLIRHPKLIGADPAESTKRKYIKEPRLLLKDDMNKEKYISAFQKNSLSKPKGNILFDASTAYSKWPLKFLSPEIFDEISDDYTCIYVVRDPIDRFESHINFKYQYRKEILKYDLEKIFDFKWAMLALNIGNYAMQLSEYKHMYEKGKLLIIDFNELVNDTKKCLEKICKKIDIDFNDLPPNNKKTIPNKTSDFVTNFSTSGIFKPFSSVMSTHKKIPAYRVNKNARFYQKLFNLKPLPKRFLTDEEKYRLAKIYKPSLMQLKREYDINYFETSWNTIKRYL